MDTLDNNFVNESILSEEAKGYLRESARWGKLISIVGFVGIGLMLLLSLFIGGIMSTAMASMPDDGANGFLPAMGTGLISSLYIGISLLYFFPVWYLYKFSSKTIKAIEGNDNIELTLGLQNLKSCFKFMGIMTIIVIGLYVLFFVAAILGGLAGFMM